MWEERKRRDQKRVQKKSSRSGEYIRHSDRRITIKVARQKMTTGTSLQVDDGHEITRKRKKKNIQDNVDGRCEQRSKKGGLERKIADDRRR